MIETLAVLITYYNEGPWLTECILSALRQPAPPDEILVYDDASTNPAEQYVPDDSRVRVIRGAVNVGPARGRNVLLSAATTTFIHYHDADDWFDPAWTTRVRAVLFDADIVLTDLAIESADGRKSHVMNVAAGAGDVVGYAIRGSVLVPSMTYRRDLALEAGGWDESLHQSEDYEFHIRLLARTDKVVRIEEDLVVVRVHPGNRSRNILEVWGSAVDAITTLSKSLPARYHGDLAVKAAQAGRLLYADGRTARARVAFALARTLSPDGHVPFNEPGLERLARWFGPMAAERCAALYRLMLPSRMRAALRSIAKAEPRV